MPRKRKYRRCAACRKLKERLRTALHQRAAAQYKLLDTEQKQRRAESILVAYKNVVLEAMRH